MPISASLISFVRTSERKNPEGLTDPLASAKVLREMSDDPRRLEGGKFFLDIAKYVLSAVAVTGFLSERVNVGIGLLGLGVGFTIALVGFITLPPKKEEAK